MNKEELLGVENFYNIIGKDYNKLIYRSVPRYYEMLWFIIQFIPKNLKPKHILELGCGTGNLSEIIVKSYPQAKIILVDISDDALNQCKNRFKNYDGINYKQTDINDLENLKKSFDLVLSSIAIHHLENHKKETLFMKVFNCLTDKGIFSYADQFAGASEEIYDKHMKLWHEEVTNLGCSEDEWTMWMEHQNKHDHHATLMDQIAWLRKAGFSFADVTWRYLLWTVIIAGKSPQ